MHELNNICIRSLAAFYACECLIKVVIALLRTTAAQKMYYFTPCKYPCKEQNFSHEYVKKS